MDSEYTYQPQYIWKSTTNDGVLPITNFTEEINENAMRKRGKDKDKGKEVGVITDLQNDEDQQKNRQKGFSNGFYVYVANKGKYGLIKTKKSDTQYVLKTRQAQNSTDFEDLEIDLSQDDVKTEMELCIRVVVGEDKRFTLVIKKATNDKFKAIAEELAEILNVTKYSLTFFYRGEKLGLNERLGDRDIGAPVQKELCKELKKISSANQQQNQSESDAQDFILCLKGGNEGPKIWRRFTTVDDPCRQLSYISDEESFDAISFIPKKDILFAGFSVYPVASTDIDFKCIYKYKIGKEYSQEQSIEFSQSDAQNKMCDIMLEQEVPVPSNKPITIMVRFTAGDEYFCSTLLGYGGENYLSITDNEDREIFDVKETSDCSKGETDSKFGQIPRIHYFLQ